MEKLNVCLINDSFPPVIDGVSNAVFNYANVIQNDLGNVVVATPDNPGVIDSYPYQVLRYPSIDTTKAVGYRTGIPFNANYLSKFNNMDLDILHCHCPITSLMLARMIRESVKKPIVLTYHTKFDIDIKKAIDSKMIQDVAIKALVDNINSVDEVWAVSRGAGENLKSLGYKGDYIVMNNGVDFEKGAASRQQIEEIHQQYDLPYDVPVYLFVGRLMWYKGLRIIADALKQVKQHDIDFRMMFVGDGLDGDDLKAYINQLGLTDRCIFTGSVSDRKKLKALFSSCDLFLFPSTFDTNGIVVREAAASGLGSVLIEGSCAAEDTENGVNCIWIKENADSLAEVLIKAGSDVSYFHQIGKNAQDQLYLSWKDAVYHAYQRYQEVIERYRYEDRVRNPLDVSDNFLSIFSSLSQGISRAKQARQLSIKRNQERLNSINSQLQQLLGTENYQAISSLSENVRKTAEMIDYRRREIQEYLDDVMDRDLY